MNEHGERTGFEICIVIEKSKVEEGDEAHDVVGVLVEQFTKTGLIAEKIDGISNDFIKLAAPLETLGRAAAELHMKKLTYIGMDLLFEWNQLEAFVRQPDGSLFSWSERFRCYQHLIFGMVNKSKSSFKLKFGEKEVQWETNQSLLERLKCEGIVKDVFPLHDETKRKHLTSNWALNWFDFTWQPIDEICSYFGTKVATYFVFLGMYTRWLFFPAFFGLFVQFVDFGSLQFLALPLFFLFVVSWSALFFQFWKRKNSAILARWGVNSSLGLITDNKDVDAVSFDSSSSELEKKSSADKPTERRLLFERKEWYKHMLKIQNNAVVILAIICLQLPFELAYAHLYEIANSNLIKYMFTAIYLLAIQYYTKIGGKMSVKLIKSEDNRGKESNSDSLVYKVFGLYFMQSYIGLFYHVLVHRDFVKLRQVLIQRLIVFQVLGSLTENFIPYAMYTFKKYKTIGSFVWYCMSYTNKQSKKKHMRRVSRVEKEYLKPSYAASIGAEVEDGLFDDFLELAVQFGMIMMFSCAFPLVFCFSVLNNVTEIRADALKLLVMFRRPVPRDAATIGAWWKIFQLLIVMSICTNCTLLVCLYDQEGKWKLEPGVAAILIMEHILLLVKFGFSHFVPEEPAWVKAKRVRNVSKAQDLCSKQLLGRISHLKEQKAE